MVRKINLIPMAGEGIRFKIKGFKIPKPLILINGIPMFVKATKSLPKADKYIFICLKRHINKIEKQMDDLLLFLSSTVLFLPSFHEISEPIIFDVYVESDIDLF